jgi:hypothetical protein
VDAPLPGLLLRSFSWIASSATLGRHRTCASPFLGRLAPREESAQRAVPRSQPGRPRPFTPGRAGRRERRKCGPRGLSRPGARALAAWAAAGRAGKTRASRQSPRPGVLPGCWIGSMEAIAFSCPPRPTGKPPDQASWRPASRTRGPLCRCFAGGSGREPRSLESLAFPRFPGL